MGKVEKGTYTLDQNMVLTLFLIGYVCVSILNIILYGQNVPPSYDYEARSVINDEEGHGDHYDFEFSTYKNTYYVDVVNNRIWDKNLTLDYLFQDWMDMSAWMANRSRDEAFQINAIMGNYRSVFHDSIHRDTSEEGRIKRRIIEVIESLNDSDTIKKLEYKLLPKDSMLRDSITN